MTLSALGIFSAAGAGGVVAGSDYDLLETQILGSSQASVVFSSLGTYSATYKHLQIRYVARSARTEVNDGIQIRLNGDSGSNYARHNLAGSGSAVSASAGVSVTSTLSLPIAANSATASAFGAGVIDFLDAYSTTKNKTIRGFGGISSNFNELAFQSGLWLNTAGMTSLTLLSTTGNNIATNSRFSLYGIKG
jgi:hypothetical protein